MSWRELVQALEVDTIYPINPEKHSETDSFQNKKDKKDKKDKSQNVYFNGTPMTDLEKLAEGDWEEIENDHASLEAFSHLIAIRRLRERGEIPTHYTAKTECQHCGIVPIWADVPEKVLSCVWCFNRVVGRPIPKPR